MVERLGRSRVLFISSFLGLASCALAPLTARAASIRAIELSTRYLAHETGETASVVLDLSQIVAGEKLRVTQISDCDLPASPNDKPGQTVRVLIEKPVAELGAEQKVNVAINSNGILCGNIRLLAEIIPNEKGPATAQAYSETIDVGLRARVSLAGEWDVTKIEPYLVPDDNRPKTWKPPEIKSATLPGVVVSDEFFRGWVTLNRQIKWTKSGDLQPRFVRLSGVTDSAAVSIDGIALPETRPVENIVVLSHWIEYHSKFKGEENAKTRMLFLDLPPVGPTKIGLPQPLAAEGTSNITIRLRGTSGMFRAHPLPAIRGDCKLDLTPPVYVKDVSFDTDKPAEDRRFKFQLVLANDSGKEFHGTLRSLYAHYDGKIAYTGHCPRTAFADQPIVLKPGANTVEIVREERPRFDTCRATFVLVGEDGKVIDGDGINYHTVTFEVRDRRDFYLNNERFIVKGQGSAGDAPHKRWQLRVMGGNAFRGPTDRGLINLYQSEGLLTSAGGALLASVEKCAFYNPRDTSNIDKAVRGWTTVLADCPGVIIWEATNELHGEPEEARIAMLDAFHKYDPYHRPVLATKGSGEWEAEARDGRVKGVDIVGCQYLLSKEGVDSITAAVTEQPIMSTEVNWNDGSFARDNLWSYWLDKGVAGSLLFDYSGGALDQPVPAVPPADNESVGGFITRGNRDLYQDLVASAVKSNTGEVQLRIGNQMPYTLHDLSIRLQNAGRFSLPDLTPGMAVAVTLPANHALNVREPAIIRAEYTTHGGLPHVAILTPVVVAPTVAAADKGGAK